MADIIIDRRCDAEGVEPAWVVHEDNGAGESDGGDVASGASEHGVCDEGDAGCDEGDAGCNNGGGRVGTPITGGADVFGAGLVLGVRR